MNQGCGLKAFDDNLAVKRFSQDFSDVFNHGLLAAIQCQRFGLSSWKRVQPHIFLVHIISSISTNNHRHGVDHSAAITKVRNVT